TRNWVEASDYWDVKFDLTKQVKEAFDQQGISIPYPHQVEIVKTVA
ncbi:MAG: mechanosensitive ion channel family protein, partial [Pseudomonadota bacterium]